MILLRYAVALGLTLAVELPVYAVVLRYGWRLRLRVAVPTGLAVNLATHPVTWWSLRPWRDEPWYPWLLVGAELAVCLVEWVLLTAAVARFGGPGRRWRPDAGPLALLSVLANAMSTVAGLLLGVLTAG